MNWRPVGSDDEILTVFTRDSTSGRADNKQLGLLSETLTFDWSHGDEPHAFVVLIGDKRIKGRVVIYGNVFHVFYGGHHKHSNGRTGSLTPSVWSMARPPDRAMPGK